MFATTRRPRSLSVRRSLLYALKYRNAVLTLGCGSFSLINSRLLEVRVFAFALRCENTKHRMPCVIRLCRRDWGTTSRAPRTGANQEPGSGRCFQATSAARRKRKRCVACVWCFACIGQAAQQLLDLQNIDVRRCKCCIRNCRSLPRMSCCARCCIWQCFSFIVIYSVLRELAMAAELSTPIPHLYDSDAGMSCTCGVLHPIASCLRNCCNTSQPLETFETTTAECYVFQKFRCARAYLDLKSTHQIGTFTRTTSEC